MGRLERARGCGGGDWQGLAWPGEHPLPGDRERPDDDLRRLGEWLTEGGLDARRGAAARGRPAAGRPRRLRRARGARRRAARLPGADGTPGAPWFPALESLLRKAVRTACRRSASASARSCSPPRTPAPWRRRGRAGDRPAAGRQARRRRSDPLFGPVPMLPDVLQWHHDEITELPLGAVLLAASTHYPHQAFRLGDRGLGPAVPHRVRHRGSCRLGGRERPRCWPSWACPATSCSRGPTRCRTTCSRCGTRSPSGSPRSPRGARPRPGPEPGRRLPLLGTDADALMSRPSSRSADGWPGTASPTWPRRRSCSARRRTGSACGTTGSRRPADEAAGEVLDALGAVRPTRPRAAPAAPASRSPPGRIAPDAGPLDAMRSDAGVTGGAGWPPCSAPRSRSATTWSPTRTMAAVRDLGLAPRRSRPRRRGGRPRPRCARPTGRPAAHRRRRPHRRRQCGRATGQRKWSTRPWPRCPTRRRDAGGGTALGRGRARRRPSARRHRDGQVRRPASSTTSATSTSSSSATSDVDLAPTPR